MKPGSEVQIIYSGKTAIVVSTKGDTVVVKDKYGRVLYLKKSEVRVP